MPITPRRAPGHTLEAERHRTTPRWALTIREITVNITRAAFRGKLRLIIPGMAVANSVILQAVHATT